MDRSTGPPSIEHTRNGGRRSALTGGRRSARRRGEKLAATGACARSQEAERRRLLLLGRSAAQAAVGHGEMADSLHRSRRRRRSVGRSDAVSVRMPSRDSSQTSERDPFDVATVSTSCYCRCFSAGKAEAAAVGGFRMATDGRCLNGRHKPCSLAVNSTPSEG